MLLAHKIALDPTRRSGSGAAITPAALLGRIGPELEGMPDDDVRAFGSLIADYLERRTR